MKSAIGRIYITSTVLVEIAIMYRVNSTILVENAIMY